MTTRCNCDASCGENRYHDVGDFECRFNDEEEYHAYWDSQKIKLGKTQEKMSKKITKVSDKLDKVDDYFTVQIYDNGYMIDISGRRKDEEFDSAKILANDIEGLITLIREISNIRDKQ